MTFLLVIPLFLKVCNSCTRTLVYCSRRKISVARMLGINLLMSVKLETRFFQRIMVFIRFSFLTIRSPDFSKLMRPRPGVSGEAVTVTAARAKFGKVREWDRIRTRDRDADPIPSPTGRFDRIRMMRMRTRQNEITYIPTCVYVIL